MPPYLQPANGWPKSAATAKARASPFLTINTILGVLRACQQGLGIAMLPDYLVEENRGLVQLFSESEGDRARCLFRLSGRTEIGRARAGVPRLPGVEGAALEFLLTAVSASRQPNQPMCRLAGSAWLTYPLLRCSESASPHTSASTVSDRAGVSSQIAVAARRCSPLEGMPASRAGRNFSRALGARLFPFLDAASLRIVRDAQINARPKAARLQGPCTCRRHIRRSR